MAFFICFSNDPKQQDDTKVSELKKLIKDLGDVNPQTREKSQDSIIKLFKDQIGKEKNIKGLFTALKKSIRESHDEEVKIRLKSVVEFLIEGKWESIKACPLIPRMKPISVLIGEKLIIFGGTANNAERCKDGAVYDINKNNWDEMKESHLKDFNPCELRCVSNRLILYGHSYSAIYDAEKNIWTALEEISKSRIMCNVIKDELHLYGNSDDIKLFEKLLKTAKEKWEKKVLQDRFVNSITIVKDKIIIWGGDTSHVGEYFNDGAVFKESKNRWFKMKECPLEKRRESATILSGNKLIIWGGANHKKCFNDGAIYDIEKNSWTVMASSPLEGRVRVRVLMAGDELFVGGGISFASKPFCDWAVYDIKNNNWNEIGKNLISEGQIAVVKGKLDIKCDDPEYTKIYDKVEDCWNKSDGLLSDRQANLATLKNKLIIWGGNDSNYRILSNGAVYDIERDKWSKMKENSRSLANGCSIAVKDNLLIIWGGLDNKGYRNDGEIYDASKDRWIRIPNCPLVGRWCHTMILVGNKLFIWGGCQGGLDMGCKCFNDGAFYELPILLDE